MRIVVVICIIASCLVFASCGNNGSIEWTGYNVEVEDAMTVEDVRTTLLYASQAMVIQSRRASIARSGIVDGPCTYSATMLFLVVLYNEMLAEAMAEFWDTLYEDEDLVRATSDYLALFMPLYECHLPARMS